MTIALPRPEVSYRALRMWQRNRDVFLNIWWSEAIWGLVEPVVTLVALGLGLGGFVELQEAESYLKFVAPGLLAVYPMWAASAEAGWGSYFRMENLRTFDAVLATPLSVDDVTTGEIMWAATRGVISSVYILIVITAFNAVESAWAVLVPAMAVASGALFGSVALCYTTVARSISSLNYFFAVYITPQFWLSGAFFPLEQMPGWVQKAAWDLAWVCVVALLFYFLALVLMRRRLIR